MVLLRERVQRQRRPCRRSVSPGIPTREWPPRPRDATLAQQLHQKKWFQSIGSYLPPKVAESFLTREEYKAAQNRNEGEPYSIKDFDNGLEFCQQLPFWGLYKIIEANYGTYLRMMFPARRLQREHLLKSLRTIISIRNEIGHHRGVRLAPYKETRELVSEILVSLEFDVERAASRLLERTGEIHADWP